MAVNTLKFCGMLVEIDIFFLALFSRTYVSRPADLANVSFLPCLLVNSKMLLDITKSFFILLKTCSLVDLLSSQGKIDPDWDFHSDIPNRYI